MDKTAISYAPRPDATPEGELNALVGIYKIVIDRAKKSGCLLDKSGPEHTPVRNTKGVSHVDERPG